MNKLRRFGLLPPEFPTHEEICEHMCGELFRQVLCNKFHVLHQLLPRRKWHLMRYALVLVLITGSSPGQTINSAEIVLFACSTNLQTYKPLQTFLCFFRLHHWCCKSVHTLTTVIFCILNCLFLCLFCYSFASVKGFNKEFTYLLNLQFDHSAGSNVLSGTQSQTRRTKGKVSRPETCWIIAKTWPECISLIASAIYSIKSFF